MLATQQNAMNQADFTGKDSNQIQDIKQMVIDKRLPLEERIKAYLQQVENPYVCKCGKTIVHTQFAPQGPPLNRILADYLKSKKT